MSQIEHIGIIRKVTDNSIEVEFTAHSACEKCHIKGACQESSEKEERTVNIDKKKGEIYDIGEKVTLFFSEKEGLTAVLWAYITPIIISILALALMTANHISEPVAALISLAIIVTYFIILYIFRRKIKTKIRIKVEKIDL